MSFMPETSAQEARQTEIDREFTRVTEYASYIEKISGELEAALGRSILASRKATIVEASGSSTSAPEPVRVPLAQSLFEHGLKLELIRERLSSILSRLEA